MVNTQFFNSWEKDIVYCETALEKLCNLYVSIFLNSIFKYLKKHRNVITFSIFKENDMKTNLSLKDRKTTFEDDHFFLAAFDFI